MNLNKVAKWSRLLVLVGLLAWVTYEFYMHQVLGGGKATSVQSPTFNDLDPKTPFMNYSVSWGETEQDKR